MSIETLAKTASTAADDTLRRKSADPDIVSGGHLVAKALKNEGVDAIFTLCGGHIIDIYDGCVEEGIRIIDVRHEQVGAHAADGYARQTGKLGCVVTTAGPGCTNAVAGIATAFRSESPVLHIGGQGGPNQHKMGSLQDLPHTEMMRPITKFSESVRTSERIADMIAMAARECFAGAYGPAYLEIPRGVLDREVHIGKAVIPKPGGYRASTKPINQIRYGQPAKYGEQRGNVGNLLGDVPFGKFAEMLSGYGEDVRDPAKIAPALRRAREAIARTGRSGVVNIWVEPREYAPGTKNQSMYK
jgi:acetolactate synthase I/II/III large subunit